MASDFEIGRVVAVDTAQVTIELNADLKAMVRGTYEGIYEVGRINSYVILPVGARRLVAMVTRVVLAEEAEVSADRTMVTLPSARRLMKATLIGTIDGAEYTQGISLFPVLDNPVLMATEADLDVIFDHSKKEKPDNPEEPGFCIELGESPIFRSYKIQINPDAIFGKHAAVIGSTGAGKSCTIAALIQSILKRSEVQQTNVVILDTNNEYRSAFQKHKEDGNWEDIGNRRYLYIPSDLADSSNRLVIPYWLLNAEDFVRLFRAREGVQSPVLLRALRLARSGTAGPSGIATTIEVLRIACMQILAHTENDTPTQQWALPRNIQQGCTDGLRYRSEFPDQVEALNQQLGESVFTEWEQALREIQRIAQEAGQQGNQGGLGATRIQQIRNAIEPVIARLNSVAVENVGGLVDVTADQPVFFDRSQFLETTLDTAMREQAESGNPGRVRDACGPMLLRVRRFLEDPRFSFLFGSFPNAEHTLATFLRDAFGLPSADNPSPPLSPTTSVNPGVLPFYDRQRVGSKGHQVVIVDLSLLAAEVLENVTALIGRLILEFLQRLGEFGGEESRGSLPVILVLEEAQNYIRERRYGEDDSISREVFERIAREGRKYGLGLVVSSQRPSELSKTVLSQCSSFIVHRLQNPEDLRYFKDIVPGIYGPLLDQLPALAPQTALVLGECVRAPALVRIKEADPIPRSRDPKFYRYWIGKTVPAPNVEEICRRWEGNTATPVEAEAPTETPLSEEKVDGQD